MQKYWILFEHDGKFTVDHEFYEDDDLLAQAHYRGRVPSYDRSSYTLMKVL